MIKIDEIEQFEKESLPQIKHQFWQLNSKTFPKEMDQFVTALKEKFADVFGKNTEKFFGNFYTIT